MVGLFPESYQATRADEIHDALDAEPATGLGAVTEAVSLALAALRAWLQFLATPTGIRNSLFTGALAWFGVLYAWGPVGRLLAFRKDALYGFYSPDDHTWAIAGAAVLGLTFLLALRSTGLAVAAGLAGIVFTAISIRAGQWQSQAAIAYEARWIGIPLLAALLLRGRRTARWPVGILAAAPGALMVAAHFSATGSRGPSYWGIQRIDDGHWLGVLTTLALIAIAFGPWVSPSIAALALPAAVHSTLLQPSLATGAIVIYLALVIWIRAWLMPDTNHLLRTFRERRAR